MYTIEDVKRQITYSILKYIQNEYNLNKINQLAIKSIHTINIQSYEYNYNKIHSESRKFNQLITILKQVHLIEHGQSYT